MHSIKLPELEENENYLKKPPQEKERYTESKIKEIIQLNTEWGINMKQIEENTYFHRNTISKHVRNIMTKGEIYQYPPDSRNGLLFSNGNLLDPIFKDRILMQDKFFEIYVISNRMGKFLYIQEKKEDIYSQVESKGGIIIPIDQMDIFKDKFDEIVKKLHTKKIIR